MHSATTLDSGWDVFCKAQKLDWDCRIPHICLDFSSDTDRNSSFDKQHNCCRYLHLPCHSERINHHLHLCHLRHKSRCRYGLLDRKPGWPRPTCISNNIRLQKFCLVHSHVLDRPAPLYIYCVLLFLVCNLTRWREPVRLNGPNCWISDNFYLR